MRTVRTIIYSCFLLALIMPFSVFGEEKRYEVSVGNSPSIGPVTAPVTIIEFLDYQ